ncbi:MAG TPA: alkaline phosphatase family protein [Candidatus Micrarchaeia archaeon]|nr:alkaline phosphatase family protein [Candidatus Micrarchaeia archaeon]
MAWYLPAAAICLLAASGSRAAGPARGLGPPIRHVFVITLENTSFASSFGDPASDPYLATTLPARGALLTQYYATGHYSLDNYIAEVSGQAPNPATSADCGTYTGFDLAPAHARRPTITRDGQVLGSGCVYPKFVDTIGNQLTKAHLGWKAYEEDMGRMPRRDGIVRGPQGPACGHPHSLGDADATTTPDATDGYATRHDPFVYFQAVIASRAYCAAHVVSLAPLGRDLRSARTTPAYSFITPNTCHDGHDNPCANGQPGGLSQIDAFLSHWVPTIMASPAYRQGGLIAITFDEAASQQTQACCGERTAARVADPTHPDMAKPGISGPGGGRVGAVLLSPFIRGGTRSPVPYNHYSLLRSIEQVFGLRYLGDAAAPGVRAFGRDVYTNWRGHS